MMDPYSDEYYEGPLGLRNPKSAQHTHAAYLLGMESMLPIYPQDQPLAYFNSSAFAPAGNSAYDCELHSHYYYYSIANCMTKIYVAPDTMTQDSTNSDRLNVCVPVSAKEKDGQPTMATIHFLFDIPPKAFLLHIIAMMGLNPETAELGWRSCDDSQWTPLRQLTEEDVIHVFQEMAGLRTALRKHRCVKPIYLEIVSLVRHLCIGVWTLTLTAWQKKPQAATASKPSLELGMLLGLLRLPHEWHGSPINVSLASCFEWHSNYSPFSLYNHKTIIHGELYSHWHWSAQQSSNSL